MLGLGLPAYAAAIGMHVWTGYMDWRHLLPALAGLVLWAAGLALSHGYLRASHFPHTCAHRVSPVFSGEVHASPGSCYECCRWVD